MNFLSFVPRNNDTAGAFHAPALFLPLNSTVMLFTLLLPAILLMQAALSIDQTIK